MIEGIGKRWALFHSVVILGGGDVWPSFQRRKVHAKAEVQKQENAVSNTRLRLTIKQNETASEDIPTQGPQMPL